MIHLITRPILFILAWVSFALGIIGIFVPGLPTTPFMILTAYLFSKSSPRMHSWLTSLPYFGNAILEWEAHRVIRPKAKATAIVVLWLVMGTSFVFAPVHYGLKIMLALIGILVSTFILTRKSYAEVIPDNIDDSLHT